MIDISGLSLLCKGAHQYTFFQAVRLLERLAPHRQPVGYWSQPAEEVVRFGAALSASFSPCDIATLRPMKHNPGQLQMRVTFMGLTGPRGALPRHYTSWLFQRAHQHDDALEAFFDLFNHRSLSFLYRAWVQSHPPLAYEQARRYRRGLDGFSRGVLALSGVPAQLVESTQSILPETPVYYAALLGPRPRSGAALASLLSDYFAVPVALRQCTGRWCTLPIQECSRLGGPETHASLGKTTVVGQGLWQPAAAFRLRVGPLSFERYNQFLPPGNALQHLKQLTRFFTSPIQACEVQLVLARKEAPLCRLGVGGLQAPRLGWSTWLLHRPPAHDPDDLILSECSMATPTAQTAGQAQDSGGHEAAQPQGSVASLP